MPEATLLVLLTTSFFFGLRHGIDWDHIAAISSITGTTTKEKQLLNNFLYVGGHALIVITLGLCALLFGITLPSWVDTVMEPIVGATLIFLGVYLIISLITPGKKFQPMSRWMLLYHFYQKITSFIHRKIFHADAEANTLPKKQQRRTPFLIGVLHGIGAETPTQLVLFFTLIGISGKGIGALLLLCFIAGLVISHTILSLCIVFSYSQLKKQAFVYRGVGLTSGIFSIIIGILFLFHQSASLPALG